MTLLKGNCLDMLKTLPDCSVDSIVTDPPYELGFMGKAWDNTGIANSVEFWAECLRVLKLGGHLLSFGGSRTYHRMACAIEDSGFEIRDQIMWLYGSGFPKSLDVSKAIDKAAGAEREVVPGRHSAIERTVGIAGNDGQCVTCGRGRGGQPGNCHCPKSSPPATPEAQQWKGWGTALKPAHEPIVVARKPLIGTVANNVLTYGTGALNIDGSRVGTADGFGGGAKGTSGFAAGYESDGFVASTQGRWPANVIHDGSDEVLAGFPTAKGGTWNTTAGARHFNNDGEPTLYQTSKTDNSEGSAARFFYCAKASKSERNAGLEGLAVANIHPTVKPIALMRYLVKLVTPPGGMVLDPFLGSGTTAVAAILEGFEWTGCEMTEDYWPIIEARTEWAHGEFDKIVVQPELTNGHYGIPA